MAKVNIADINFDNKHFWRGYIRDHFIYGYDDKTDTTIDSIEDYLVDSSDLQFWDSFTGWDDSILDEGDGYLEDPAYIDEELNDECRLKIEFHPGDTIYYLNGNKVGSIGPHYELNGIPFELIKNADMIDYGEELFWLCLPMVSIQNEAVEQVSILIADKIEVLFNKGIFDKRIREDILRYIIGQLM